MRLLFLLAAIFSSTSAAWCPHACRCDRSTTGDLEVVCPESQDSAVLSVYVKPDEFVQLQCTPAARPEHYALLEGLQTGQVPVVNFLQCPLPSTSLLNLTRSFGVQSISSLQFQSFQNLSYSLTQAHLEGLTNVTRLRLSSNNFTTLPKDLFKDLPNLTNLDLRDNNLVDLSVGLFDYVPSLSVLELGMNLLEDLKPGLFRSLPQLKLLNIWNNRLSNLSAISFANLTSLTSLDLHSNSLKSVPVDLLKDLKSLEVFNIFGNNISSLPQGIFAHTPALRALNLYSNQRELVLPSRSLSYLRSLEEVYLMKSNLNSLPEDLFRASVFIVNLSLSGNHLVHLKEGLLSDQKKLKLLDLSYNDLESLPEKLFRQLESLETLRLGYNRISEISRGVFKGLKALKELDLEHNQLSVIDHAAFLDLKKLNSARLSHNRLSFLNSDGYPHGGLQYTDIFGNESPFHPCESLETLYLANNSITEVFSDWKLLLRNLKTLDLSYNKFKNIETADIQFPPKLSVDLRHNQIEHIILHDLELLAGSQENSGTKKSPPRILLEDNPLLCDCFNYPLAQYVAQIMAPEAYYFVELVPGNLRCSAPPNLNGELMAEVFLGEFVCPWLEMCPQPCACAVRPWDNALVVNCSSRELQMVPDSLPTTAADTNHTELMLENNQITRLPNVSRPGYDRVTHLFLSGNQIETIDTTLISKRTVLLTLDNNNLSRISTSTLGKLSGNSSVKLLTLQGNPWICDCSAREMLNWLLLTYKKISFFDNITCNDGRNLTKLSAGELCPAPLGLVLGCAVVAAFGIVAGACAAFYYRYNHAIRVWMYAHRCCLWLVTEEELDKNKRYDAFVSFSHKDEDFVINTLVPRLESTGMKLCLHYRDWVAGEWIPAQIARSVEDSKRTLVVLSPNFLDSVWGRLEFRAAHKQALSEGRARVVMLLYGDVPPQDQLDPELRAYISVNTYVKYGDPWFWDKLNYALPHAPLPRRKRKKYEDRIELIRPAETPVSSPTTPPILTQTIIQPPGPCSA